MLCDPADQVAGLPNMPPILTLLPTIPRSPQNPNTPSAPLLRAVMENDSLAKGFKTVNERTYGWLDYNPSDDS
jgi:hypothetical protein